MLNKKILKLVKRFAKHRHFKFCLSLGDDQCAENKNEVFLFRT